jgi:hypothetical protein
MRETMVGWNWGAGGIFLDECGGIDARRCVLRRAGQVFLEGGEGALEERVVEDVAFAVLSADDPVTAFYVDETKIGGDCSCF